MNFAINSTLIVLTGLTIITAWLLVGYIITNIWWNLIGKKMQYTKKRSLELLAVP